MSLPMSIVNFSRMYTIPPCTFLRVTEHLLLDYHKKKQPQVEHNWISYLSLAFLLEQVRPNGSKNGAAGLSVISVKFCYLLLLVFGHICFGLTCWRTYLKSITVDSHVRIFGMSSKVGHETLVALVKIF